MSTGSTTLPENGQPDAAAPRRRLPRLRDARIRSKLALILVVPIAAVLALAAVRLVDVGTRARAADRVHELTALSVKVSELIQYLHRERMAAARYLGTPTAAPDVYQVVAAQADQRIETYNAARRELDDPPPAVQAQLQRIDNHLLAMGAARAEVLERRQMNISEAVLRYGVIITDLAAYGEVLGRFSGAGPVADELRAVSAFARAKAGTAEQEAVAYAAQATDGRSEEDSSAYVATQASQQEALLAFYLSANPTQRALVDSTVTGDAVVLADQVSTELSRSDAAASTLSAAEAANAIGAVVDLMRWAELRLESRLLDDAAADSSSVARQAAVEAILVLLTLIAAVVLAVVLARSLNTSLRRLREGALAIANRDLPDAVARLRDVRNLRGGDTAGHVRDSIQLDSRDEIGQVAQAFNVVHKEAVRIAAEQAALRTSVSAMFLNLARRSQSLVDRMIGELDQIERGEEDPKRLAQLFELDHLATRMRRNDENLLVLAGADSSAPRREDALLVDALRAAQSEVEIYNRVEFGTIDADVFITAIAVNDVVRLIAELLDNATRFSPPNTVVVADGRRIRDGVVVQVEDRGLGMSEQQMDVLNRRLAQPPGVDAGAFRLMGLAVAGRLASRYGIRVELRANIEGGTVAQVTLPSSIVVLPNRPIEPVRLRRAPRQPGSEQPRGSWGEPISAARAGSATATLPAIAPEPWQQRTPADADDRFIRTANARTTAPVSAPPPPRLSRENVVTEATAAGAAPETTAPLPVSPEQTPLRVLPDQTTRSALTDPAVPAALPAALTDQPSVWGSPTVAYPTLQAAPVVGFVNPDGTAVSTSTGSVSSNTSGWGAALAAMPSPPPPPAPAPVQDRAESPIFQEMQVRWFQGHVGADPEEWSMPTAGYAPPPNPMPGGGAVGALAGPLNGTTSSTGRPSSVNTSAPEVAEVAEAPEALEALEALGAAEALEALEALEAEGNAVPASAPVPEPAAQPEPVPSAAAASTDTVGTGAQPAEPAESAEPAEPAESAESTVFRPRPRQSPEGGWRTAADEGWHRAVAAAEPDSAGTTRSGLPKRVPQAQLVPGAVQSGARDQTRRSPDEVRGLLSAYHHGVQRGRTAGTAEAASSDPAPKEIDQ